jgi:surface protein
MIPGFTTAFMKKTQTESGFTFTVKTDNIGTSSDSQFQLPLYSGETYNCVIHWGDDSTTTQTTDVSPTHTYASAGTYTITVSGAFAGIYFNDVGDKSKLTTITSWGDTAWQRMDIAFRGCDKLISVTSDTAANSSAVTSMYLMFYNCFEVVTLDASGLDTSNVTDMSFMFNGLYVATTVNVSGFDTAEVLLMTNMFTYNFVNTALDVSSFNTAKVTDMAGMFYNNYQLAALDVSGWLTPEVTNMAGTFRRMNSLASLDLSGWDTSKVTSMTLMFEDCYILDVDVSGFNIPLLTNALDMFIGSVFSNTNYDLLLASWSAQIHLNSVALHAGTAKYTESAARTILTDDLWTITDGGAA